MSWVRSVSAGIRPSLSREAARRLPGTDQDPTTRTPRQGSRSWVPRSADGGRPRAGGVELQRARHRLPARRGDALLGAPVDLQLAPDERDGDVCGGRPGVSTASTVTDSTPSTSVPRPTKPTSPVGRATVTARPSPSGRVSTTQRTKVVPIDSLTPSSVPAIPGAEARRAASLPASTTWVRSPQLNAPTAEAPSGHQGHPRQVRGGGLARDGQVDRLDPGLEPGRDRQHRGRLAGEPRAGSAGSTAAPTRWASIRAEALARTAACGQSARSLAALSRLTSARTPRLVRPADAAATADRPRRGRRPCAAPGPRSRTAPGPGPWRRRPVPAVRRGR